MIVGIDFASKAPYSYELAGESELCPQICMGKYGRTDILVFPPLKFHLENIEKSYILINYTLYYYFNF